MSKLSIIIGAQWGDEGKGKWVDILSEDADIVVRFQGGNNAGHTLYVNGEKTVLHQIPSGILRDSQKCCLTAGVVINPSELVREMDLLTSRGMKVNADRLWLSARAHVITPWSVHLDHEQEKNSSKPIGTTKRGIGPTYALKAARQGLRLGSFVDTSLRNEWLETMMATSKEFSEFYKNTSSAWHDFFAAAERLHDYVCDAEARVRKALQAGKKVLMEGAQGSLLDIDHGTYPFVTSSSTAAGGAFASLGFSARHIDRVLGVAKAYLTRVGSGPFPTELTDEVGAFLAKKGHEFGATTGRPRRCGWLDLVALKYAVQINGFDGIIFNKFDILSGLKEVKAAVAYQHPTLGRIEDFPFNIRTLAECQPVYESFAGWAEEVPRTGKISALPTAALNYVAAVEKYIGVPIVMVGTGVNRGDGLYR